MKRNKTCQVDDMLGRVRAIPSSERAHPLMKVDPLMGLCDKKAKHSVVYRCPALYGKEKMIFRLCDTHFKRFKESDKHETDDMLTRSQFVKYR
jgi:hypothetical protein